ncbi:tat pathway signal sequence [Colletotrichum musicola]|uniref:Tat pathway signal sequence n=1 Tax=Colletotrichum musicola TaxID=2175873 RepID=A0A8H6K3Z6_9PEZI|nr:tat pathway signal sequence [Colletotrichum musicola]
MPPIKTEPVKSEAAAGSVLYSTPAAPSPRPSGAAPSFPLPAPTAASATPQVKSEPGAEAAATPQIKAEPGIKQERAASHVDNSVPPHGASPEERAPEEPIDEAMEEPAEQNVEEHDPLEKWINQTSPEVLEEGVAHGIDLLEDIKFALEAASNLADTQGPIWLKAIRDLEARSQPSKTIVGVVGNTGAGKSSVINALLDEERLLPTNCLRACTASPTEISYNNSNDPSELYRAEIVFITAEDWMKELKTLFTDLIDDSGNLSRECTNPDTEAGIAYAKIKSVYPTKTREMIAESSPENLANEPAVRGVLGSTKKLKATAAKDLYASMQRYVDSKEKNNHLKKDVPMEFWPLIKVVHIYTKANALSTGAVIVDLPGVQDSNAARAAVAQNYMKACTGLWIVAPINRAVDDKTAKSLLGDSFKRQLKYDGIYSAVTFICSKTDDISVTEAAESLDIETDVSESWAKIDALRRDMRRLKGQLSDGKDEKSDLDDKLDQVDNEVEKWDELAQKHADGDTVHAPTENRKKRKRGATSFKSRKNRKSSDSDSDSDSSTSNSDSDKENDPESENRMPLTEEQIEDKISAFKTEKKKIRQERKEIEAKLARIRKELKGVQAEEARLLGAIKAVCIQGRNGYSKGAIQRDFAMGIKEQVAPCEAAIEQDEDAFNPDEEVRDYDEVARNLPVFCVSSRAYQKMQGRLQKDDFHNDGFRNVEETEIPQLQNHAKKLTEAGRAATCRRFLNDLSQLLNSMRMWASNDGTQVHLSASDKRNEETCLRSQLAALDRDFAKAVDACVYSVREALAESIYDYFELSIPMASNAAVATASGWGAHRSEGGMFWATYKATCRRSGVYSGASGPRDFNAELFEPISRQLATGWERAFQRRIPQALEGFAMSARGLLDNFHRGAIARSEQRGTNYAGINMLSQQLRAHTTRLKEIPEVIKTAVQELQREANRGFHPVITADMQPAYDICVAESGQGSYARMKRHMVEHVENSRHNMFRHSTDSVKEQLQALCKRVEDEMASQVQGIYNLLARDYLAVLVGVDAKMQPAGLPRAERILRGEMLPLLQDARRWFDKNGPDHEQQAGEAAAGEAADVDNPFADDDGIDNVDELLMAQIKHEINDSNKAVKAEAAM